MVGYNLLQHITFYCLSSNTKKETNLYTNCICNLVTKLITHGKTNKMGYKQNIRTKI